MQYIGTVYIFKSG